MKNYSLVTSAATLVDERTLLVNRDRLDATLFGELELIDVDPSEPEGANVLRLQRHLIYASAFPHTRARLERSGLPILSVDVSELAKAEGAVTCCCLIVNLKS